MGSPDCWAVHRDEASLRSTWKVSLQAGISMRPVMVTRDRPSPWQVYSNKAELRLGQAGRLQVRIRETWGWAWPWAWAHWWEHWKQAHLNTAQMGTEGPGLMWTGAPGQGWSTSPKWGWPKGLLVLLGTWEQLHRQVRLIVWAWAVEMKPKFCLPKSWSSGMVNKGKPLLSSHMQFLSKQKWRGICAGTAAHIDISLSLLEGDRDSSTSETRREAEDRQVDT